MLHFIWAIHGAAGTFVISQTVGESRWRKLRSLYLFIPVFLSSHLESVWKMDYSWRSPETCKLGDRVLRWGNHPTPHELRVEHNRGERRRVLCPQVIQGPAGQPDCPVLEGWVQTADREVGKGRPTWESGRRAWCVILPRSFGRLCLVAPWLAGQPKWLSVLGSDQNAFRWRAQDTFSAACSAAAHPIPN